MAPPSPSGTAEFVEFAKNTNNSDTTDNKSCLLWPTIEETRHQKRKQLINPSNPMAFVKKSKIKFTTHFQLKRARHFPIYTTHWRSTARVSVAQRVNRVFRNGTPVAPVRIRYAANAGDGRTGVVCVCVCVGVFRALQLLRLLTRAPLGGHILPPLSNIRDNLRTT